jgi:hypothetical protein
MVAMAKQAYEDCKLDSCGDMKDLSKKEYEQCKKDKCDKSKIKETENEWKKCQKEVPLNIISGNRVCNNDGYACQTACWTAKPYNNREIPLRQHEALGRYRLSLAKVRDTSVRNYEFRGNSDRGVPAKNYIGSVLGSGNPRSQLALPTCKSSQLRMGDYNNKFHTDFKSDNRRFPATCGDWRSNETALFLSSIGFGVGQALQSDASSREALTVLAPYVRFQTHSLGERAH